MSAVTFHDGSATYKWRLYWVSIEFPWGGKYSNLRWNLCQRVLGVDECRSFGWISDPLTEQFCSIVYLRMSMMKYSPPQSRFIDGIICSNEVVFGFRLHFTLCVSKNIQIGFPVMANYADSLHFYHDISPFHLAILQRYTSTSIQGTCVPDIHREIQ